ncbi:hypothetical protein M2302_002244 [Micromonospora sp. A200]|nr:hypothetical protein [Micromonospora sp. A200]
MNLQLRLVLWRWVLELALGEQEIEPPAQDIDNKGTGLYL